ncbi:MAG TPA: hypothetical protein VFK70_00570 [Vicinamibacteria bacterium]|nr:hypothetical protein [Vicinamibacteria bacterium]
MAHPYERYVQINLPHARTVLARIGRMLEFLGALSPDAPGGSALQAAFRDLERAAEPYDDDPAPGPAVEAADALAARARVLVDALLATPVRSDRLGQHVRNLFECLGLPEEGAELSLRCGEKPDSLMR